MKKSELIKQLSSSEEDDVLIDVDGTLYEIEIDHVPETFDGFYTTFPAAISLKPKEENENN